MLRQIITIVFLSSIILVSCQDRHDSNYPFSPESSTALSSHDLIDLGFIWEMTFKDDNGERRETHTQGIRWDGYSKIEPGKLYYLTFEQAERYFADNPKLLSTIEKWRNFSPDSYKMKSTPDSPTKLASVLVEEMEHYAVVSLNFCKIDRPSIVSAVGM